MFLILWTIGLSLLMQGCLSSAENTERGCREWTASGQTDVCCGTCNPGNRLYKHCGPDPKQLCVPCEPGTYTTGPMQPSCAMCTQCIGVQFVKKECTSSSDTVCGCIEGLLCGNDRCTFCVKRCGKGEEPDKRSCRPCPPGTFNDQIQRKCKPWRKSCPLPDQHLVEGDAFSDRKCAESNNITVSPVSPPKNIFKKEEEDDAVNTWAVFTIVIFLSIILISICGAMVATIIMKRRKSEKVTKKPPVIRTPTDDPRTLIAIECSFHEAQQEQGSSSESLASKDSENPLIA